MLARISAESKAHILRNPPKEIASHHLEEHLHDPGFDTFYGSGTYRYLEHGGQSVGD